MRRERPKRRSGIRARIGRSKREEEGIGKKYKREREGGGMMGKWKRQKEGEKKKETKGKRRERVGGATEGDRGSGEGLETHK